MKQEPERKTISQRSTIVKEDPKVIGEDVIILIDEERKFSRSTEVIFDQRKFEQYNPANGFSLVFWIYFNCFPKKGKPTESYIVLLIKNRFTAELTVGVKDKLLFMEIKSPKSEKTYSGKVVALRTWYQVVLTCHPDQELSELILYLNGKPESTITYNNTEFDALQGSDVQFGKFKAVESFEGLICDSSISFFPLSAEEVTDLFAQGRSELKQTQSLATSKTLLQKSQGCYLRETYAEKKKLPQDLVDDLEVDPEILKPQEQVYTDVEVKPEELDGKSQLRRHFNAHPDIEAKCSILAANFEWAVTVTSIMAVGRIDTTAKLEVRRFMEVLDMLKTELTLNEVNEMANILCVFDENNYKFIYFYEFLKPIKMLLSPPQPVMNAEKQPSPEAEVAVKDENEKAREPDEDRVDEASMKKELGEEEKAPIEENKEEVPAEEVYVEPDLLLPELKENWCDADFILVINRCHDCHTHRDYTWHYEEKFINLFNETGTELKKVFTNIIVLGNYEKLTHMEGFDVYIRGVGFSPKLDETGRFMLFSKNIEKRFPTPQEIVDKVIMLVFTYGDTFKLAESQSKFISNNEKIIPKPYKKMDKHPIEMPASAIPKPVKKRLIDDNTKKICQHWGCSKIFTENDNKKKRECRCHPGRFEFGSVKGWWPEGWSCCRNPWESEGCTLDFHSGVPVYEQTFLCINRGQIAPKKTYPDSFCGAVFTSKTTANCAIHIGYLRANKTWSCCEKGESDPPCSILEHKHAIYPNEEAKIYFFNAPCINPGLITDRKEDISKHFTLYGRFSGYFKKSKEYKMKRLKKKELTNEEQEARAKEERYCFHWSCEKKYKEAENKDKKPCQFHPGRWDFGPTGETMTQAMQDKAALLWEPHWTCCRKKWKAPGCTMGKHSGPLLKDLAEVKRYKWPDIRAQTYFQKRISGHWKKFMVEQVLKNMQPVDKTFDYFAKTKGSEGRILMTQLPTLLDTLKLHLLVVSKDLSFHFKFLQVMKGKAENLFEDGEKGIERDKFLRWWKMNLDDTLRSIESDEGNIMDDEDEK